MRNVWMVLFACLALGCAAEMGRTAEDIEAMAFQFCVEQIEKGCGYRVTEAECADGAAQDARAFAHHQKMNELAGCGSEYEGVLECMFSVECFTSEDRQVTWNRCAIDYNECMAPFVAMCEGEPSKAECVQFCELARDGLPAVETGWCWTD